MHHAAVRDRRDPDPPPHPLPYPRTPHDGYKPPPAPTIARAILSMRQEAFSAAFKGSPMKRAKLRGLQRNAAVVLGNVGDKRDVEVLRRAVEYREPL